MTLEQKIAALEAASAQQAAQIASLLVELNKAKLALRIAFGHEPGSFTADSPEVVANVQDAAI